MRVKLGIARWKGRQQATDISFINARVLQEAEDVRCVTDFAALKNRTGASGEEMINGCVKRAIEELAGGQLQIKPKWIKGKPQPFDAKLSPGFHQNSEDN